LHLLGYDHGDVMERREHELLGALSEPRRRTLDGGDQRTEAPVGPGSPRNER
jgi:hypothetical protein